jgi:hypothetical protein
MRALGASPTKPSFDPKRPLEVQCPLVRPRSEQNRSLGGRASQNGATLVLTTLRLTSALGDTGAQPSVIIALMS